MNQEKSGKEPQSSGKGGDEDFVNPPIQMWVRPRMDSGKLEWDVDFSPPNSKGKKPILLGVGTGPHEIKFHIHDPDNLGLNFDCTDPIYAEDNVACPPAQSLQSGQIPIGKISCNANTLTITDENSGDARLIRYQLNFVYADNSQAAPCDPVILNGGGGGENS